jgi:hypothetical protein
MEISLSNCISLISKLTIIPIELGPYKFAIHGSILLHMLLITILLANFFFTPTFVARIYWTYFRKEICVQV